MLNLNLEMVFSLNFLHSNAQSKCDFEVFLVDEALPLTTCLALVFGVRKQIQIRVLNDFIRIIFWLQLFDLDSDLFIS